MNVDSKQIAQILKTYQQFTVLGLSPDSGKPSHSVPMYMRSQGYQIVGVYPGESDIGGVKIYSALKEVPLEYRKMINVFRASNKIPTIVDEILALGGCKVLWLQLGISHPEAEAKAEAAGLKVISDRCILIEHRNI